MSHISFVPPALITMGLALQPALTLPMLAPQPSLFSSPAMQLLMTGLITAGVLYLTNWFTQKNLKMSIENNRLQAEAIAAELKSQAGKVDKIAESTAATQIAQVEIGTKVNGQMTALQSVIEGLRSDLTAAKLAIVTEEEKATALAMQAIKDTAAATARLVAAQQVPSDAPAPSGAGVPLAVTIPATPAATIPVHDSAPLADPPRIIKPS